MTIIIGLAGAKRSGKTSAANYLAARHGFRIMCFADPLRDILGGLDPIIPGGATQGGYQRLSEALREAGGWEGIKGSPFYWEVRGLLQRLGTEAGRMVLGQDIWVDALESRIAGAVEMGEDRFVIPDVRFPNEMDRLLDMGGSVYRLVGRGVGNDPHPSERALDGIALTEIENDMEVIDLHRHLDSIVEMERDYEDMRADLAGVTA
ncbi:hypothetical protein EDD28_0032 [Salana multivorans]|uniref:Dephospho-CoA kinase n=2 Tax=Salana multivorans TaxID=120377 RepID=A0A3N2D6S6_9MICO|nr:hypothetical protein [Salana multivorans]ROR95479.1 hypothetical protein EDD28_0032 [Salana multivorans]